MNPNVKDEHIQEGYSLNLHLSNLVVQNETRGVQKSVKEIRPVITIRPTQSNTQEVDLSDYQGVNSR